MEYAYPALMFIGAVLILMWNRRIGKDCNWSKK